MDTKKKCDDCREYEFSGVLLNVDDTEYLCSVCMSERLFDLIMNSSMIIITHDRDNDNDVDWITVG